MPSPEFGAVRRAVIHLEQSWPGIFVCGNYLRGVSVSDTIESGLETAETAFNSIN